MHSRVICEVHTRPLYNYLSIITRLKKAHEAIPSKFPCFSTHDIMECRGFQHKFVILLFI